MMDLNIAFDHVSQLFLGCIGQWVREVEYFNSHCVTPICFVVFPGHGSHNLGRYAPLSPSRRHPLATVCQILNKQYLTLYLVEKSLIYLPQGLPWKAGDRPRRYMRDCLYDRRPIPAVPTLGRGARGPCGHCALIIRFPCRLSRVKSKICPNRNHSKFDIK